MTSWCAMPAATERPAESVCADKNQDWENEKTTFIFYDGSIMVFSGPEKWVEV